MPVRLNGSTSGYTELSAPAVAANNTLTLPTTTNGSLVALDSSGRLGIGTTPGAILDVAPDANRNLQVQGKSGTTYGLELKNGTANAGGEFHITAASGGGVIFNRGTTEMARLNQNGLGIGTTSPGSVLSLYNTGADTALNIDTSSSSNNAFVRIQSGGVNRGYIGSAGAFGGSTGDFGVRAEQNLCFYPNAGSEKARIDTSGRLLVGTSASFASTAFLQVNTYQNGAAAVGFATKPSTNANYDAADFYNSSGTLVGYISCTSSATSYSTSSDYRLKENVEPITGATDRILQLSPSRFNFIVDPDHTVDGFLAHEAQEVVPECVTGEKDAVNEDGNPVYQGIDQSKLVPLLTAALQEAITKIASQGASIAALETRLTALEVTP
jgi:hypothetical protein